MKASAKQVEGKRFQKTEDKEAKFWKLFYK